MLDCRHPMTLMRPFSHYFRLSILLLFAIMLTGRVAYAQNPGISSPLPSQTINGVVLVTGTANDPNFLRYELAFLREADSGAGWIVFADGSQAVVDGTLAVWDTTVGQNVNAPVFPDGQYQLRLRVVRQDFNYDEFFVTNLTIANSQVVQPPTPTPISVVPTEVPAVVPVEPTAETVQESAEPTLPPPTPDPSVTPTDIPTPTPLITREAPTLVATLETEPTLQQPDVLPTLTPFPTPTIIATTESQSFTGIIQDVEPEDAITLVETVSDYDFSQFGKSFRNGFLWPFYLFGAIAVYIIIRNSIRWLWKLISSSF